MSKYSEAEQLPDEDREHLIEAFNSLNRHRETLRQAVNDLKGLELAAYGVLLKIVVSPCRSVDLANSLHYDPSTVSRHVNQLVENGLVSREKDKTDGRAITLVATEKGIEIAGEVRKNKNLYYDNVFRKWNKKDREKFVQLLHRFVADAEELTPDAVEHLSSKTQLY